MKSEGGLPHSADISLQSQWGLKMRKRRRHHSVLPLHRLGEWWVESEMGLIVDWWSRISAHHMEEGFVVGEEGRQVLRRGLPHPVMENTEINMISFQLSQFPSCQP